MASSGLAREHLLNMKRPELQKLAKDHNIKANLRTDQLVDQLIKQNSASDEKLTQQTRSESATSQSSRRKLRKSLSQPAINMQAGHTRTSSKDLAKPVKVSERKPIPTSTISRSAGVKDGSGKENGVAMIHSSNRTIKSGLPLGSASGTTNTQRGLAGKISAFGRSIAKPSTITESTSSRLPTKSTATSSHESRILSLEAAVAELLATTSSLQERLTATETELEGVRQELLFQQTAVASRDEEIEQLKGQLKESQEVLETVATQNLAYKEELEQKAEEMSGLQRNISTVTEEVTVLKTQMEDLKDTSSRVEAAENTLSELNNKINNRTPAPRHVGDFSHLRGTPASPLAPTRLTPYNYAVLQHGTHSYLNLELNSSPSRRRHQGWEELGHDMLAHYNGYGRQCLDSPKNVFSAYM